MTTLTPLVLSLHPVNETLEIHDEGYIKILSPFSLIAKIIRKFGFLLTRLSVRILAKKQLDFIARLRYLINKMDSLSPASPQDGGDLFSTLHRKERVRESGIDVCTIMRPLKII
jgi:hypothetical protein